ESVFKNVWQYVSATLASRGKGKPNPGVQSVGDVLAANPRAQAAAVEPPITAALTAPADAAVVVDETVVVTAEAPAETVPPEPWVGKHENGSVQATAAGKAELAKYVTNTDSPVYGFTD